MKKILLLLAGMAMITPAALAEEEWINIGEGTYKEILFSDLYALPQQTLKVTFEQNAADPNLYRIPDVYENMDFTAYDGLTYDAATATPMVIHVYNGQYAYFEEFDTGVKIDHTNAAAHYQGEVRMLMQGVDLLVNNDIETLVYYLPESLCEYYNGLITLESAFMLNNKTWNNVLGLVYVTGTSSDLLFKGNQKGDFLITMPSAMGYDPDEDWEDIGNALFTDCFTEDLYPGNAEYHTYEVAMQRNTIRSDLYRLVNPYAKWPGKIEGVTYDNDNTFYMNLVIEKYNGFSLVGIPTFLTGLMKEGEGYYSVSNQAADLAKDTNDFLTIYTYYPGCFGMMEDDGVIKYPSHCAIDMDYYLNFFGYFGTMTDYSTFYSANSKGNFKIVMPGYFTPEGAGVEENLTEGEEPVEYYNLQGIRVENPAPGQIVVRRQGKETRKMVFK